jgi:chromosome segregation ATPase
MKRIIQILVALSLATACIAHAAENTSKREKQLQRRMQQQMQQISAERDALAQENATLAAKVKEFEAAAAGTESTVARLNRSKKSLESEMQALRTEHYSALQACRQETQSALQAGESLQQKLAENEQKLADTSSNLMQAQAEKKGLQGEKLSLEKTLEQHGKQFAACQEKNRKLYGVTREVIDRQRNDALFGKEPLFGLGKVEVENLFQEYEDRAYAEKIPVKQ